MNALALMVKFSIVRNNSGSPLSEGWMCKTVTVGTGCD
jgi:hypothetical protein